MSGLFGKSIPWVVVFTVMALILAACGGGGGKDDGNNVLNENGPHAEAVAIYKKNCLQCHASDLTGRAGKQSDISKVGDRLTEKEIAEVIRDGGIVMPSFGKKLKEDEIEKLAAWLAEQKSG